MGVRIEIGGVVQGVGFRPWVYRLAREVGITGRVVNGARGVTIEAHGQQAALARFVERLRAEAPRAARIVSFRADAIEGSAPPTFSIEASTDDEARRFAIGPDLATCPACLAEVSDPADRRHGYAFTTCTGCGPRFSIALAIPYDRARTTMAGFAMCRACRREYHEPSDRRFHAQPNACPRCGPRLSLRDARGAPIDGDPIEGAAEALLDGAIVLVKGLGGFHFACDATSSAAVRRLRRRKARDEKPFALMAPDLEAAEALVELDGVERELLTSVERPIVLARRRASRLAPEVAPDSARLGVMLPYTPLHHLLLARVGRPLVMTSANLMGEPTAHRDDDAAALLGPVADRALTHDRTIAARVDDSIAVALDGAPTLLRRSRGWVPRPVPLAREVREPILGCGAQLKNTFCIAVGDVAYMGPHIGDLDSLASYRSYQKAISRMEQMLGVSPALVAHDLHPDLASSRYARERGGRLVAVQHHHAHIASVMAEHGLAGDSVIGVAFDGTGYGLDGTSWGGEVLLARAGGFERVATLRPIRLAGGERAITEPWRVALALLEDAFEGEAPLERLALFGRLERRRTERVRALLARGLHCPPAHGAGRYFDAFAAIALDRPAASYEAQLAMALELVADAAAPGRYGYAIDREVRPWQIDLRPAAREAAWERIEGTAPAVLATRFHRTLAEAVGEVVRALDAELPVALSGGCFQNALLSRLLIAALGDRRVLVQRQVPPNDGGIALGQVWVASCG